MKNKLNFILLIVIFLLTGCKVEYNLDIDNSLNLKETVDFISNSSHDTELFKETSTWNIPIEKSNTYDFTARKDGAKDYYQVIKNKEKITYNYSYRKENYEKYQTSTFANLAYRYVSITAPEENILILSSSKEFLVFDRYHEIDEVKINIHTNYKVITNNADEVNGHNYTWVLTPENASDDKNIYLKIDTSEEDLSFKERFLRGDYLNSFTLSLLLFGIAAIIYIILKTRGNINNKI